MAGHRWDATDRVWPTHQPGIQRQTAVLVAGECDERIRVPTVLLPGVRIPVSTLPNQLRPDLRHSSHKARK